MASIVASAATPSFRSTPQERQRRARPLTRFLSDAERAAIVADAANQPRKLTDAEIEDIVQALPSTLSPDLPNPNRVGVSLTNKQTQYNQLHPDRPVRELTPQQIAAISLNANSVRAGHQARLREQLKAVVITPLGLPTLKKQIIKQMDKSFIPAGETVGVTAAEAMGGPVTQMALNSFHSSGSKKAISSGVERIKELVNLTSNPKSFGSKIYFKDTFDPRTGQYHPLTFDEAFFEKRADLVGLTAGHLVVDTALGPPSTIVQSSDQWWLNAFKLLVRSDVPRSSLILRLYLDVNAMFMYRVTLAEVAQAIERETPPSLVSVYPPSSYQIRFNNKDCYILDLYPVEANIATSIQSKAGIPVTSENAPTIYLSTIVVPNLDNVLIKGVPGIRAVYPTRDPVLQIVQNEDPVDNVPGRWRLRYNTSRVRDTGIGPTNLAHLMRTAGFEVVESDNTAMIVQTPPELEVSPSAWIVQQLAADDKNAREYELQRRTKEGRALPPRLPSALTVAATFVAAEADGSNLKYLLSRDDIDSKHTVSNNANEILRCLGIEAARNFLISEFLRVLCVDSYVNPRHITLLVDYMTVAGRLVAITFAGMQRQPTGALSKATFQQALKVLMEAAVFGAKDSIVNSTSAAIMMGTPVKLGTGSFDVILEPALRDKYLQQLRDKYPGTTSVAVGTMTQAIQNMDAGINGAAVTAAPTVAASTVADIDYDQLFGTSTADAAAGSVNGEVTISVGDDDEPVELVPPAVVSGLLQGAANRAGPIPTMPVSNVRVSVGPVRTAPLRQMNVLTYTEETDLAPVPGRVGQAEVVESDILPPLITPTTAVTLPPARLNAGLPPSMAAAASAASTGLPAVSAPRPGQRVGTATLTNRLQTLARRSNPQPKR